MNSTGPVVHAMIFINRIRWPVEKLAKAIARNAIRFVSSQSDFQIWKWFRSYFQYRMFRLYLGWSALSCLDAPTKRVTFGYRFHHIVSKRQKSHQIVEIGFDFGFGFISSAFQVTYTIPIALLMINRFDITMQMLEFK